MSTVERTILHMPPQNPLNGTNFSHRGWGVESSQDGVLVQAYLKPLEGDSTYSSRLAGRMAALHASALNFLTRVLAEELGSNIIDQGPYRATKLTRFANGEFTDTDGVGHPHLPKDHPFRGLVPLISLEDLGEPLTDPNTPPYLLFNPRGANPGGGRPISIIRRM